MTAGSESARARAKKLDGAYDDVHMMAYFIDHGS